MRIPLIGCVAMASAVTAFAGQTQTTTSATQTTTSQNAVNQPITMTGCVNAGATASDPFTLSNVTVLSQGSATPGAPTGATAGPILPPAGTAVGATGTATGTTGTTGSTGSVTGTTGVPPVGGGTTGTTATGSPLTGANPAAATNPATATTPATASTPSAATGGYRLTGADITPFAGQRVQIVGTLALSSPASPSAVPGASAGTGSATSALPMLRITSVHPVSGSCQQQ